MYAIDFDRSEVVMPHGKGASQEKPSPRSGHRMVHSILSYVYHIILEIQIVWRGYIILFGGFYEALRDVSS
jgi:hypothetical protein